MFIAILAATPVVLSNTPPVLSPPLGVLLDPAVERDGVPEPVARVVPRVD